MKDCRVSGRQHRHARSRHVRKEPRESMVTLTPIAEAQKLATAIPNAELVVIPRAGHLSNLEQPEPFNAALATFLSRL